MSPVSGNGWHYGPCSPRSGLGLGGAVVIGGIILAAAKWHDFTVMADQAVTVIIIGSVLVVAALIASLSTVIIWTLHRNKVRSRALARAEAIPRLTTYGVIIPPVSATGPLPAAERSAIGPAPVPVHIRRRCDLPVERPSANGRHA